MVVAALFEQIVPSHRGLTRNESIAAAGNEDHVWHHQQEQQQQQPYHAMDTLLSSHPRTGSSMSTSLSQLPPQPGLEPFPTIASSAAATRQRRKRCKATKCLASLAADFDVVTDWMFYFHCRSEDMAYRHEYNQQQRNNGGGDDDNNDYYSYNDDNDNNDGNNDDGGEPPYLIPPVLLWIILIVSILGTILWLVLATDGKVASPLLRLVGVDKLSMGYLLFLSVIVEDLPQVVLTFLVEDYFEENGEFNNYALVNVIASLYDTLIRLAEAFDERADIVETGIWCKESLWAHKKKVTCVVPIPIPEEEEDYDDGDDNNNNGMRSFSSQRLRRSSGSRMHVNTMRGSVRQNLLEEAKEIVSETKLPRLRFLSASKDQTVRQWDTNAKMVGHKRSKCVRIYRGHSDSVSCLAFVQLAAKNRRLVDRLGDTAVRDKGTGSFRKEKNAATAADTKSNVNEKAMYFLTGSYDGTVRLWNSSTGQCCRTYIVPFLEGGLRAVKVTSVACLDNEQLASSSSSTNHMTPSSFFRGTTLSQKQSRDLFVSGYKGGKIRMWNILTETCLAVFDGHAGKVYSLCCLKNTDRFASTSEDGTVKVWTSNTPHNTSGPLPVCVSATTDSISINATETAAPQTHTMDSVVADTTQSALQTFVGHTGPVLAVASVSRQVILTGSVDRTARVWNIDSGACLRVFAGHTDAVTCVAIVDHVTFLTGSKDCTIKVWDGLSATCIRTYSGHTAPVTSVSTTLQSGTFISASEDQTVKLWVFTAVMPIVSNEDGGTLNDLLGMDDSLACMTCHNNNGDTDELVVGA